MAQPWPAWLKVKKADDEADYLVPRKVEGGGMWIAIEAPHKTYVDISKMCRLYVARIGSANYKVVGQLGDADLAIKTGLQSEAEAQEWLDELIKQAMA